jgi:hypothetical protein
LKERNCYLCGYDNPDAVDDHFVAFWGHYGYWGPTITLCLCVNCHQIIHRFGRAPFSPTSRVIFNKYLLYIDSLPPPLPQALRWELQELRGFPHEAKEISQKITEAEEKRCLLCNFSNPDVISDHPVVFFGEFGYWGNDIITQLCANCCRIINKFYFAKEIHSPESQSLFQKYLSLFDHLPEPVKENLKKLSLRE